MDYCSRYLWIAFESRYLSSKEEEKEKVAKKNMKSGMKIWKINCWRKVPLEMLCLVDGWIIHIYPLSEELIEKAKHWPVNLSIRQVPLDQLCFVEWRKSIEMCCELLFISRLFKTESSKDEFRSYHEEET